MYALATKKPRNIFVGLNNQRNDPYNTHIVVLDASSSSGTIDYAFSTYRRSLDAVERMFKLMH